MPYEGYYKEFRLISPLSASDQYQFDMNFHFQSNYRIAKNNEVKYLIRTGNHMVKDASITKMKTKLDSFDIIGYLRIPYGEWPFQDEN